MNLPTLRRKFEFGDAVLFPYIVTLVLQCFRAIESGFIAWMLTVVVSTTLWLIHLQMKPEPNQRTPRLFWLVVGLPLFAVFALRAPIPDLAFDVLSHRLIQAERALRGPQLLPGDFFPTIFPFNPLPDMLTGIFRHLLGYRLGTVINLLAIVWAGTLLEKILRPVINDVAYRCVGVLLVLFTEHILFQINSYMVDVLALPLMLEPTRLALRLRESNTKSRDLLLSALLLGAATALKLTNAAMVIPIALLFAYQILSSRIVKQSVVTSVLAAMLFFVPLLPHALYIFRETASPVFPLYNDVLRSPLWPKMSPYDGRWGPRTKTEALVWPLATVGEQARLSELGVYSGRLTLAVGAALLCLLLPGIERSGRMLATAVILESLLWSFTSGYVRYGLLAELLGGVTVLYLARYLFQVKLARQLRLALGAVPVVLLVAQTVASMSYVRSTEWSKRPTLIDDATAFRQESRWFWRDRDLMSFQSSEARALFEGVDAWIVSSVKTNGIEVLLRPNVPMLAVNNQQYFDQPESRRRFRQALENLRGKRVYSLCLTDDTEAALNFLKARRLVARSIQTVVIPFFSRRTQFHMQLIEVGLPEKHERRERSVNAPAVTEATEPLNDEAFVAAISSDVPAILKAGQVVDITVCVKNASDFLWPARGRDDYAYLITVSNAWLDKNEALVDNTDGKSGLPHDLWPGEEAWISLKITAPFQPGQYILEIDLVQEGIAWFKDKGSTPWRTKVRVE